MPSGPVPALARALSSRAGTFLLGGLLLRELFSFWTGHPYDFEVWIRTGYQVSRGANPYNGFLPAVPGVSFSYTSASISSASYLPLWPLTLGGLYRLWDFVGGGNRFVLYFLLKQPGILADVGTAYILYRLALRWAFDERAALGLLVFWSFFSYAVIITAIWGQFDSIVVLVLLGTLWFRGSLSRNVLYGIGIFAKWVTVIFLPLEFLRERRFRRFAMLTALAVPAALTALAFAAEGWSIAFLGPVSGSQVHGGGLGMNLAFLLSLPYVVSVLSLVPGFYTLVQYAWIPGVIVAGWAAARWVSENDARSELRALMLIVTAFLLLRWGLYEQYMLFLFAPAALDAATFHPGRRALLWFTVALSMLYLLVNNDLGMRFLAPADPGILTFTTSIDQSGGWGAARTFALAALAVMVTVTLVQWIVAIYRDEGHPRPWIFVVGSRARP